MIGFVILEIIAGGVTIAAVQWLRRRSYAGDVRARVLDVAWTEAALELGGSFRAGRERPSTQVRRIEAHLAGQDIVIDHTALLELGTSVVTHAETRRTAAIDLELALLRRDRLRSAVAAFDDETMSTGDTSFDRALIVKSRDAVLARAWLDAPARKAMLIDPPLAVEVQGDAFRAIATGIAEDGKRIAHLGRVLAIVAGGGRRLLARWASAAHDLGGKLTAPGDDWASGASVVIALDLGRHPACVQTVGKSGVVVELTLTRATAAPLVIVAEAEVVMPTPPLPRGYRSTLGTSAALAALPPRFGTALADLAPLSVTRDGAAVQVMLDGIDADVPRWRAALALADTLVDDEGGPYR